MGGVVETPRLKRWGFWREAVGYCFQLQNKQINSIKQNKEFLCPTNEFSINYTIEDIRHALSEEIPGYVKPEDCSYLAEFLKKLNIK